LAKLIDLVLDRRLDLTDVPHFAGNGAEHGGAGGGKHHPLGPAVDHCGAHERHVDLVRRHQVVLGERFGPFFHGQ
jgi:hypothetical protein